MGALIAAAGLAPDALMPLRQWSIRQVYHVHAIACRENWRKRNWQAAINGINLGSEPDWGIPGFGSTSREEQPSAPFTEDDEIRYAELKARLAKQSAQLTNSP